MSPSFADAEKVRRVGKSVRRREGGSLPAVHDQIADRWWAPRSRAFAHPESISNGVICGHSFAISDLAARLLEREITSSNRKEIAVCGGAAAESRLNSPLAVTASPSAFSKISLAPWRPSFVPRKARSRSPACGS